jgi:pimeloyl-ACP methyl ester carboxylesterase
MLGTYAPEEIQGILDATGASFPFSPTYTVEVRKVHYYTVDRKGNSILVSGAMFFPQGTEDMPLLSLQHGTETKRNLVASVSPTNSVEGTIALLTASMGYATLVPDYPGFGSSKVNHPYMHASSLVPSIIDMIRAGKSYISQQQIQLNGKLFLTGYSEGGFLSLATQKTIEEEYSEEFNLSAVAPLSGPYDLRGMFDTFFTNGNYSSPAYVAYFLFAYNEIFEWDRLHEFIKEPYASLIPGLFDGSSTWGEAVNQLPENFEALVCPGFIAAYLNGSEPHFIAALDENTLLNWRPAAPIHFIHGDADQIVPYENATKAFSILTANGAENIQLSNIPEGTHASSGPAAISKAMDWFETF